MSATKTRQYPSDDARPFGEVVEEIIDSGRDRIPDGEGLARMRNLLHDAIEASDVIADTVRGLGNANVGEVTIEHVGLLAIHAQRLRWQAELLEGNAAVIERKLDDLYQLSTSGLIEGLDKAVTS